MPDNEIDAVAESPNVFAEQSIPDDAPDVDQQEKPSESAGETKAGSIAQAARVVQEEAAQEKSEEDSAGSGGEDKSDTLESLKQKYEEARQKADSFTAITEGLAAKPAETIKELVDVLSQTDPGLRDAVLRQLKGEEAEAGDDDSDANGSDVSKDLTGDVRSEYEQLRRDPSKYVPASGLEAHLLEHLPVINALPAVIENVASTFGTFGQTVDSHSIAILAMREMMDAIAEDIGMEPAPLDHKEIEKAVQSGKTLQDAVKELYGNPVRERLKVARQRAAERPVTLANGSGGNTIGHGAKVTSIREAARLLSSGRG